MDLRGKVKNYFANITDLSIEETILRAIEFFGEDKIVFASSLGIEDQVLTHIIRNLDRNIEIFTIDTGRLFYEAYETIVKTETRYNFRYKIYFPDYREVEKVVYEKGINFFYESIENRKICCEIRKIEPLKRALRGKDCWITGLTRYQSVTRESIELIGWDDVNGLFKLNLIMCHIMFYMIKVMQVLVVNLVLEL